MAPTGSPIPAVPAGVQAASPESAAAQAPSPALTPPPGSPRFPLFDGLRGLAVLAVLLAHTAEVTGRLAVGVSGRTILAAGAQSVIVFFAISGFLIYRPFVAARAAGRRAPAISRYARRRALRIVPAYWTLLTLLAIFPGIVGVFTGDWWRYYGYLQLYSMRTLAGGLAVAWTLCVELTFYLLLPLWVWGVRRLPSRGTLRGLLVAELVPLAVVGAGGLLVQLATARQHLPYPVGLSLAGQISWIAVGMGFAVLSVAAERSGEALSWLTDLGDRSEVCWGAAALLFVGLVALIPKGGLFGLIASERTPQAILPTLAKLLLEGSVVTLYVLPAVFGRRQRDLPRRLMAWRPLAWIGVIAYSFYLWHLTVVEFIARGSLPGEFSAQGLNLQPHLHFAPTLVLFLISLAVTAALATISYRLIELPFLRLKESRRSYPRAAGSYPPTR